MPTREVIVRLMTMSPEGRAVSDERPGLTSTEMGFSSPLSSARRMRQWSAGVTEKSISDAFLQMSWSENAVPSVRPSS